MHGLLANHSTGVEQQQKRHNYLLTSNETLPWSASTYWRP